MSPASSQPELFDAAQDPNRTLVEWRVTLDYPATCIRLEWLNAGQCVANGRIRYDAAGDLLRWELQGDAQAIAAPTSLTHRLSIRSQLKRLRQAFPISVDGFRAGVIKFQPDQPPSAKTDWTPIELPAGLPFWAWLEGQIVLMLQDLSLQREPAHPPLPITDEMSADLCASRMRLVRWTGHFALTTGG